MSAPRVTLVLLQLADLEALLADPTVLDGVPVEDGALPPPELVARFRDALRAGDLPFWRSIWAYVVGSPDRIAGSACFKGPPSDGRVEIGYGVADAWRGKGIATSGARQLVEIAFLQDGVREVLAETRPDNPASQRVLEKTGLFQRGEERDSEEDGRVIQWLARR
ncbi:MAG: GNAT family N-acetyltransferase [Candidatus Eisenbacteria bacterium]|nr:GNAT family N-acetyltransferase [Candidatus Eisenbacteria bacterium]